MNLEQNPELSQGAINQIQQRRTQMGSPQTNGFCERFHRTLKEEFLAVAFRKTEYESRDQLQVDLDRYLAFYNREWAHQGYCTKGVDVAPGIRRRNRSDATT